MNRLMSRLGCGHALMVLSLILFFNTGAIADEGDATGDEAELRALLETFLVGASTADASVHDRFWAEDLVYTASAGNRFGKAEIMSGLDAPADPDAPVPSYSGDQVAVRVFDTTAVVTFRLIAETAEQPTMYFFNTGVFRKRDDAWQAIAWQATRAADDQR